MFERSFIESGFSATGNRRLAALLSMTFQAILIAVLILLPLLFTEALPKLATFAEIVPPPPAGHGGNGSAPRAARPVRAEVLPVVIRQPRVIPSDIAAGVGDAAPAPTWGAGGGTGEAGDGVGNGIGVPGGVEGITTPVHFNRRQRPSE